MLNNLPPIIPKKDHNYVAFFLTFACNLKCPYCINLHNSGIGNRPVKEYLKVDDWISAANRLVLRDDLALTLQGGEPTLYKDFYRFVNEVKPGIKMDLLTNMTFDADKFIKSVPLYRFTREAPYAAIRVSFHPGQSDIQELIRKILRLQDAGFRVGIYGIMHPDKDINKIVGDAKELCLKRGIDFRDKEFLGEHGGRLYGTYKYEGAVGNGLLYDCECKSTELIVDPCGGVYRCHADLYAGRGRISHILEPDFTPDDLDKFRPCSNYGDCNPCDIKVKTNRMQIYGHTSVEIRRIKGPRNP